MMRVVLVFLRRLWLPLVFFLGFSLMCLLVYQHLEGLRWQDALFWIINPHAIEYRRVRDTTKFFSTFVHFGVFAFQIWVAERLLITVFNPQSVEALENYGQRHQHRQTSRSLHHLRLRTGRTNCRGSGVCIVIDNDSDNLYLTVTAKALNPKARIITRAGQARYAQAMRNSAADEVIIPEYQGGLMTGRVISKYYPVLTNLE